MGVLHGAHGHASSHFTLRHGGFTSLGVGSPQPLSSEISQGRRGKSTVHRVRQYMPSPTAYMREYQRQRRAKLYTARHAWLWKEHHFCPDCGRELGIDHTTTRGAKICHEHYARTVRERCPSWTGDGNRIEYPVV